ncbi:hypothetical protein CLV92_1196 [Kineococcus xinjiangensis]|uniref:Uncharacterized protein n=1 Tax=Kineococcus xinjiangensis TaxID=512762 RepID=A0A2S6ICH8_9ACTN|nr:hypothetical protein [Kineococcus xinjiangensis]PPK91925.1 hypothetical protein CLV92_1196 [Kineococcus xinjiangensis]
MQWTIAYQTPQTSEVLRETVATADSWDAVTTVREKLPEGHTVLYVMRG